MQEATRVLDFSQTRKRLLLFTFFVLITLAPLMMTHVQWLTGPFVNAMLILACVLVGPTEAIILGLLPSPAALSSGLLPLPLAPMLPFIMIGNALFIVTFHSLRRRTAIGGVVAGAVLKYLFLAASMKFLLTHLLTSDIATKASVMMGLPQLITALIGGAIALAILRFLPRRD